MLKFSTLELQILNQTVGRNRQYTDDITQSVHPKKKNNNNSCNQYIFAIFNLPLWCDS